MRIALAFLLLIFAHPASAGEPLMSGLRQLTFEGKRAGEGYFSADGIEMIFQSEREAANPFYQIYLMDLETGDIDRVSPGHGKTTCGWIHPSGAKVLFASTQSDPEAREKMRAELEFRGSGQERRYAWDYDPAYEIQEYDRAAGNYRNLTNALGYDAEGAYSPNGEEIVFASNRAAYGRTLTEDEAARLERDPAFFMEIYAMNANGGEVRRLTDAPGYDGGPFWSADGEKIVWRRFSEDGTRAEIYTMKAGGSDQQKITDLGALSWAPFFHPSGDYVVFATNLQGFANFELYMVDAAGAGAPVRVTDREGFDGLPSFSPDGKRISWTSNHTADGASQIFLANWNDAEARRRLGLSSVETPEAATLRPRMAETGAAIRVPDLRAHVAALASDAMAGRLTGTPGELAATNYVAEAFRALGLEAAGDDSSFIQEFAFTAGVSLGDGNMLEIATAADLPVPRLDQNWRPLAFSRSGAAERTGVAFAGFGLVASAEGEQAALDSYGDLDPAGKWVMVWRGLPNQIESERRIHLSRFADLRYKASVARSKGAVGMIVAPAPGIDYEDELPRLAYESTTGVAGLPVIAVDRTLADAMLAQAGPDFAELTKRLDAGEEAAGRVLEGVEVAAQIALNFEQRRGRNVLARLDLGAPDDAAPVVIGAHLDHLGRGETSGSLARGDEKDEVHYGADDNASGIAALIEIAQSLAAERAAGCLTGTRDIVFAAWSGEELGLLGSSHFVDALAEQAGQEDLKSLVAAYLNMDMVGRLRDRLVLLGLGSSETWAREVERRNAVTGLPIVASNETYLPTDATEFYLAGVPILAAFTGAHEEYHTPRDRAESLNYEGLEQIARFMALVVRSQARAETPPLYVAVARSSGEGNRRMSGVYLGTVPDYAAEGQVGVPLSGVVKGGPAELAGVKGGDVMVGLAGTELANIYDFVRVLNGLEVGEPIEIVVERNGGRISMEAVPGVRE